MKNKICFVLDDSPSMIDYQSEALKTFNENITSVQTGQAAFPDQQTEVAVILFDGTVRVVRELRPVDLAKPLTENEYRPSFRSATALYDAVGKAVDVLGNDSDPDTSFLVVVITDGEENQSRFFSAGLLKRLMAAKEADGRWSFAFMVPNKKSYKHRLCALLAIPDGNVSEWETSARGIERASQTLSGATQSYYTSRSVGQHKTTTFFANLQHVAPETLKQQLEDVTDRVRIMGPVDVEAGKQIRDFVADRTKKPYVTGSAYYMLIKSEKVQPQKQLIIRDTRDGKFYAGPETRTMVGLPLIGEHRLRPGVQNGYEVYVQSTSVNRKVVKGMKVVLRS